MEAEMLANRAKAAGIPVYYDVDDLVFDYEKISGLHFLKGSEYSDFCTTTDRIRGCMGFCDGYFTSTETLAGRDPGRIPGKTGGDQPQLYEYGDGDPVSRGCGSRQTRLKTGSISEFKWFQNP